MADQLRDEQDQQWATDELSDGELPAKQECQDQAQLDDEVRQRDLKCYRRGDVGALRNSVQAGATAAWEQEGEAAPSPLAVAWLFELLLVSSRAMVDFLMSVCTMADSTDPSIRDHVTCPATDPATPSASNNLCQILFIS